MSRDDEFRAYAAEARAMADKAQNGMQRECWLQIAQSWMNLAGGRRRAMASAFARPFTTAWSGQSAAQGSH